MDVTTTTATTTIKGNTCFLNSVLQCLTYTPALALYLCSGDHSRVCTMTGFCILCEMENHIRRCVGGAGGGSNSSNNSKKMVGDTSHKRQGAIEPRTIINNIRLIAKHFRHGRQEDAHELARFIIEAMQRCALRSSLNNGKSNETKMDFKVQETTVINKIFGGYFRSQVVCGLCGHKSNTYDPFLDLSLEIDHARSISRALRSFTQVEVLDAKNKYKCERCGKHVQAGKQLTIYKPPNILMIQLKRFDFGSRASKLNKEIQFDEVLDLSPFISDHVNNSKSSASPVAAAPASRDPSLVYHLYGVIVHLGHSLHSGHYFSYCKAYNDLCKKTKTTTRQQQQQQTKMKRQRRLFL